MMLPPVALVRQFDTHRLVLSRHLPQGDSVLVAISDDDAHLQAIFELDAATNDRLLAGAAAAAGHRRRGARVRGSRMRPSSTRRSVIRIRSAAASTGRAAARGMPRSRSRRRRRKWAFTSRFSSPRSAASKTRSPTTTTWPTSAQSFTTFDPRAALAASRCRALDPDTLRRISGAGRATAGGGVARRDLSERAARGRHVRRLLQARARGERAARERPTASRGTAVPSRSITVGR